ncbi:GTP-binding protein [Foetidibacter luteolus]|uniref:GTP-binding protein n=1 Tax=Foetidibacter luteolus TaxID=2608880 RepID=UPI00129A3202|nr:GTP-binding protein [Foetidibacter luteolus]
MKIHLLSGFLGSGKTTAVLQAARLLMKQGIPVGVITNDQGIKLVDAGLFSSQGIPGRQVGNGCFCCNYNQLEAQIQSLEQDSQPQVVFAESVGSCTDIVATVLKPLRMRRPNAAITISVFADIRLLHILLSNNQPVFDDAVNYIYFKQLEEAGIIIVNKTDLASEVQLQQVKQLMAERYRDKTIVYQNSLDEDSITHWLFLLNGQAAVTPASLDISYDIYGAGEAMLAWFDEELHLQSAAGNAARCAIELMRMIAERITSLELPIGHLKFLLNSREKISVTATAGLPESISFAESGQQATLLVNARVQTSPSALAAVMDDAIRQIRGLYNCEIKNYGRASFQPGFPTPVHRIAD